MRWLYFINWQDSKLELSLPQVIYWFLKCPWKVVYNDVLFCSLQGSCRGPGQYGCPMNPLREMFPFLSQGHLMIQFTVHSSDDLWACWFVMKKEVYHPPHNLHFWTNNARVQQTVLGKLGCLVWKGAPGLLPIISFIWPKPSSTQCSSV